jgi:hypothetical protein
VPGFAALAGVPSAWRALRNPARTLPGVMAWVPAVRAEFSTSTGLSSEFFLKITLKYVSGYALHALT